MKNKNIYLTIGIIVILTVSIAGGTFYFQSPNPSPSSSPSSSQSPSSPPSSSLSPSASAITSPTANPTDSPLISPSSSSSSETTSITVTSSQTGSNYVKVDGETFPTPKTFQWSVGSTHSLQAISPVAGASGTRFIWDGWSDGGAQTHNYVVPNSGSTVTAVYKTQYQVTFSQSGLDSSATGTVASVTVDGTSTPQIAFANMPYSVWADAGTQVTYTYQSNVTASAPGGLFMLSSASSASTTINGPVTITGTYGRAVIDYVGNLIHIPPASQINRIADSWAAHNTIVVMVGARDKLVATVPGDKIILMFQKIFPPIKDMDAPFDSSGTPNVEQLLAIDPDIIFVSSTNEAPAKTMENSGFLVVRLNFLNFPDMTKCVQLTGWILGEEALSRANAYVSYFNQAFNDVTSVTSQIPASEKPSIYHISGNSPLYCDGNNTLGNSWIEACGGTNAAAPISGNGKQVTFEQVLAWNPDMILIGSAKANDFKTQILGDAQWAQIKAVQDGKVIVNPMGVFDWSRYSVEEALNIQWVAKTLHPDRFANIDIRAQTRYFYQTFYEYTLSEAEIDAILFNLPPPM